MGIFGIFLELCREQSGAEPGERIDGSLAQVKDLVKRRAIEEAVKKATQEVESRWVNYDV